MRPLLFVVIISCSLAASARVRAVRHPGPPITPKSVLWIAAHPDDEAIAAPLLAKWCIDDQARCALLILTRGESGPCLLPGGCAPDVRSVRSAEAASAAELFHAELILLRQPDGGGVEPPRWDADLVATVAGYIEAFQPELVLTFDPRHGTTCHPDHRETGRIVLEAVQRLPFETKLYFLETRVDPTTLSFSSAAVSAERFDATQHWSAIVADMQRHPSQFDERSIAAINAVPAAHRAVYIAPANVVLGQPVAACD